MLSANTKYIPVEPLPPITIPESQASNVAPAALPVPREEVPEWERDVPPPAIAQAVPTQTIDGAAYRAQQRGAPMPSTPTASVATPPRPAASPMGFGVQTPNYSPFRDDSNAYALVVEHRGVAYYLKEMNDVAQGHANTFERRFASNPRNRVVDVAEGTHKIDRPLSLEEVEGGEIEWFGQKETVPAGAVYLRYPQLKGHLTVRHLSVEEVGDEVALMQRHPSTHKKLVAAREAFYAEILEMCLVGWSIEGVEVNRRNIDRLVHEVKRTLYLRLGAGSLMGLSEADFFRRPS